MVHALGKVRGIQAEPEGRRFAEIAKAAATILPGKILRGVNIKKNRFFKTFSVFCTCLRSINCGKRNVVPIKIGCPSPSSNSGINLSASCAPSICKGPLVLALVLTGYC